MEIREKIKRYVDVRKIDKLLDSEIAFAVDGLTKIRLGHEDAGVLFDKVAYHAHLYTIPYVFRTLGKELPEKTESKFVNYLTLALKVGEEFQSRYPQVSIRQDIDRLSEILDSYVEGGYKGLRECYAEQMRG